VAQGQHGQRRPPPARVLVRCCGAEMDPLIGNKPEVHTENLPTEEGYVYGHAPKEPEAPPDLEGMFEAAGIPGPMDGGSPFTAEWYAGAKDRAIARDKEMQELLGRKDVLRTEWANLVSDELAEWAAWVDKRASEPQRVGGLAELLARTAHERPGETDRIEELQMLLTQAASDRERCEAELANAAKHLRRNEDAVRAREAQDKAEEEERKEEKRKADARRAKAERMLERQAALMRGEEYPASEIDEEEEGSGEEATQPPPPPTLLPAGAQREGAARTLPPLKGAPPLPTL